MKDKKFTVYINDEKVGMIDVDKFPFNSDNCTIQLGPMEQDDESNIIPMTIHGLTKEKAKELVDKMINNLDQE